MNQPQPPKIEFPCENYLVKVLGDADDEMHAWVIEVMEEHAPGFDRTRIKITESSKGTYHSITFFITATGVEQLTKINEVLRTNPKVKMVM